MKIDLFVTTQMDNLSSRLITVSSIVLNFKLQVSENILSLKALVLMLQLSAQKIFN